MTISFYELMILTYISTMWIVFPMLTNEETTYLQGVRASHIIMLPILLFGCGLGFTMSQYK